MWSLLAEIVADVSRAHHGGAVILVLGGGEGSSRYDVPTHIRSTSKLVKNSARLMTDIQYGWPPPPASLEGLHVLEVVVGQVGDLAQDLEVADDAEPAVEEEGCKQTI